MKKKTIGLNVGKGLAKCSKCDKTWRISGKPTKTDMLGYYIPSLKCLPKHDCKTTK